MNDISQNTSNDPESIIKLLMTAMSANDAEKIRSLFNSNASQAYGDGAAKSGKAFFSWLESDIIKRKGHVDNAKYTVNGNEVVVTGQYSSEGYTNKANFLFTVKDGQIMSWQMRY
ncbi:nuclear transport factor 2 family protein [Maribacter hydrothermalis]|nr:nuclear transport factor 2 family protein [Maribacter hydrothermalis]